MPRLHLVRHAKPAAGWGQEADPGLDPVGHAQARTAAERLAQALQPLPIYTSPLRRCCETARPLADLWRREPRVFASVAEIPSPPLDLPARHEWLTAATRGTWADLQASAPPGSIDYLAWRRTLLDSLLALTHDCVIYSHYIAINTVVCFRPDHASVTVLETRDLGLHLVELGREADTLVLPRQ
jgi:broad specificity phosphatase PhoE